ncbi:MAG: hypothetical protein QOH05_1762, partial [Acetobacteraceae bacterium]|nr:hypothetical protein [Acetobacteraceae bacterium]
TSVFKTTPVSIPGTFETSFDFQFNSPTADGFAFVLQKQGPNAGAREAAERLAPVVNHFCVGLGRCAHDLPRKLTAEAVGG